jgi:Uncharacterized conserved protein
MKYAFAAILTPEENGLYSVNFPDISNCFTSGDNIADAIHMAQDALCLILYHMEQEGKTIPAATNPNTFALDANEFASMIAVDTETYRRFYENKSVKKTLTLPMWLNEQAERANINFSQTLQKALKDELEIAQ